MYLWRKSATHDWTNRHEQKLRLIAGHGLAIIERPDRKRLQIEVASDQRTELVKLAQQFGGQIEKLPHDWLTRSLRRKAKPIKVGTKQLTIPAGAAFGTGEHVTTAMCLKLLQRVIKFWGAQAPPPANVGPARTFGASPKSSRSRGRYRQHARRVRSPDLVIDLGTGSGILALAAKCLGAKRVLGLDNDPIAISTAKQNAKLNKIRGAKFRVADVLEYDFRSAIDVVTANLFSELLIEILPGLRAARWLIFSGILRAQESGVRRAFTRTNHEILEVRRRGKWVAILGRRK